MSDEERTKAHVEFPSELEIRVTRAFKAPIALVFDVLTKPEHMVNTIAPFGEDVKFCNVDLRVGGDYHYVFVTNDGYDCSFRGTFLEVEPPIKSVETWRFDGWPDVEAVESVELRDEDGWTTMTYQLTFSDRAGRDHMSKTDGLEANFDNVDRYLRGLTDARPSQ